MNPKPCPLKLSRGALIKLKIDVARTPPYHLLEGSKLKARGLEIGKRSATTSTTLNAIFSVIWYFMPLWYLFG